MRDDDGAIAMMGCDDKAAVALPWRRRRDCCCRRCRRSPARDRPWRTGPPDLNRARVSSARARTTHFRVFPSRRAESAESPALEMVRDDDKNHSSSAGPFPDPDQSTNSNSTAYLSSFILQLIFHHSFYSLSFIIHPTAYLSSFILQLIFHHSRIFDHASSAGSFPPIAAAAVVADDPPKNPIKSKLFRVF